MNEDIVAGKDVKKLCWNNWGNCLVSCLFWLVLPLL